MSHRLSRIWPLALLALTACGGGSAESDSGVFQACSESYAEPVLTLSNATDSVTGAQVRSITISGLSIRGVQVEARTVMSMSSNISLAGSDLLCQLPCAFSSLEGEYWFTVKATGYLDKVTSVTAAYSRSSGSCVVTYSGTTSVSLQLNPQ